MAGTTFDVVSKLSDREPSISTQFVLCALAALEGADNQLLGASLATTEKDLNFTLNALAVLTSVQAITANLACPFWGICADRGILRQKDLMMMAAVGQGAITIMLALASEYGYYMIVLRALNGCFLAGLRPLANGVVAKTTSGHLQGKIFSRILIFINFGTSICSLVVTPMSDVPFDFMGSTYNGWRLAWVLVGLLSVVAAAITAFFMEEAPAKRTRPEQSVMEAVMEEWGLFVSFLTMPTFVIMVVQGIFGTIPWSVMYMMTRYYQLGGSMDGLTVGILVALNPVSGSIGTLGGGWLADKLALRYGANGRPLVAQLTVALGFPCLFLNFYGVPPEMGGFWIYLLINALFGLLGSWALAGCNWPVLSQIVPEDSRSRVMAVEGALENSLANAFGPMALAFFGNMLGFDLTQVDSSGVDLEAARLLGTALMITTTLPTLVCLIFYSILHYTVPRDFQNLAARQAIDAAEAKVAQTDLKAAYLTSRGASSGHV